MVDQLNLGDFASRIDAYEGGEFTERQEIELFAEMIQNGTAWTFQGWYGRRAMFWIEVGVINRHGKIDWDRYDECIEENL